LIDGSLQQRRQFGGVGNEVRELIDDDECRRRSGSRGAKPGDGVDCRVPTIEAEPTPRRVEVAAERIAERRECLRPFLFDGLEIEPTSSLNEPSKQE
jgi:hypothetical protein